MEIGLEGNDSTEIASGINEGDRVVTQEIKPVTQQAGGAIGSVKRWRGSAR